MTFTHSAEVQQPERDGGSVCERDGDRAKEQLN